MFNPEIKNTYEVDNLNVAKYESFITKISVINAENIETELIEFTPIYSYYHGLLVYAKKQLDKALFLLESTKATIKTRLRESNSKASVAYLEDTVNSLDEVKDLNVTLINREESYGLMKAICLALEHKKDMLIQISANRRTESKLYN